MAFLQQICFLYHAIQYKQYNLKPAITDELLYQREDESTINGLKDIFLAVPLPLSDQKRQTFFGSKENINRAPRDFIHLA